MYCGYQNSLFHELASVLYGPLPVINDGDIMGNMVCVLVVLIYDIAGEDITNMYEFKALYSPRCFLR